MVNFVFQGRAFGILLLNIRLFALPKRWSSLSRIIMIIPDNHITFSEDDLQTLVDKAKCAAEDVLWRILELVAIAAAPSANLKSGRVTMAWKVRKLNLGSA